MFEWAFCEDDWKFCAVMSLPAILPLLLAVGNFFARDLKQVVQLRWLMLLAVFAVCLWMTGQAYHLRNAYLSLDGVRMLFGVLWALVATVPSVLVLVSRRASLASALGVGVGVALLSAVLLTPMNFLLYILFSLE